VTSCKNEVFISSIDGFTGSAVFLKEVNFLSFNCKNIKTIGPFLHHHHNKIDILLLQEHWLFDHELSLLNDVSQKYLG
jgi:hypothetical protein